MEEQSLAMDIFDQAEVWSTIIALMVLAFKRKQPNYLTPVIVYLFIALILYSVGNVVVDYKAILPQWLQSNNPLYNIHSLVRFTCFTIFFFKLNQPHYGTLRKTLPVISLGFMILYFIILGNDFFYPDLLSSRLLTVEAFLLLVNCMLYYLSQLKEDVEELRKRKDFWITTGLGFYVVINFFVFLFYGQAAAESSKLAEELWYVHNVAQIIFCLLIAKAFYVSSNN